MSKITGKDITREQLIAAIDDNKATNAEICEALGMIGYNGARAVDGALQREKRNGSIIFDPKSRRWRRA